MFRELEIHDQKKTGWHTHTYLCIHLDIKCKQSYVLLENIFYIKQKGKN